MLKILKVFYYFTFRKKPLFVVFILTVILAAGLFAFTPYFYKLFVDSLPTLNYSKLLSILFIYIGVRLIAHNLDVLSAYLGDMILLRSAAEARQEIFKYVQDLDFAFHSEKSTGSLISAFKRGDGAFFTLFQVIHFRLTEIAVSLVVMLYFFSRLNWQIAATIFISFLITLIATKFLIGLNIKKRNLFNKEEDIISGIVGDNMINFETVKLFAKEEWEQKRLKKSFVPWLSTLWGYANSFRLIDFSLGLIINLSIFAIIFLALKEAVALRLSLGDFVLITAFISGFFPKLWELVFGLRDIAKNYADLEKYFGLLDYQIEVLDPAKPVKISHTKGKVEFNKVSFSYRGGKLNALRNFSLKIQPGQSIALVGRSGSGKTTLVKLLMRFYDTDAGEITVDGVDTKNFNKSDLRSLIGVVPQEPILFNTTIGYNIGYGKESATLGEIKAAAKLANIDDFIETLPNKYHTQVGERGVKLSGGQKQRLAIARMILSNPDIIIFDEATSHLDSESEKLIQEAFWKVARGKTTLIIAHRLSTVMRADKIVVMENGRIKEIGSHKALLRQRDSLYKHFWDLQIKLD